MSHLSKTGRAATLPHESSVQHLQVSETCALARELWHLPMLSFLFQFWHLLPFLGDRTGQKPHEMSSRHHLSFFWKVTGLECVVWPQMVVTWPEKQQQKNLIQWRNCKLGRVLHEGSIRWKGREVYSYWLLGWLNRQEADQKMLRNASLNITYCESAIK